MRLHFIAAAALCLSVLHAHADTISQTLNTGPFVASSSMSGGNLLTIDGFDPSLGTLQSVDFAYSGTYTVLATGYSNGFANSQLGVTVGPMPNYYPEFGGLVSQYELGTGTFDFSGSSSDSNPGDLAYFTQSGVLDPYFEYADGLVATDSSQNFAVTITYDYTPAVAATPESSSIFLLGIGLLSVVGVARKRFVQVVCS
jgi:hypothetical protein